MIRQCISPILVALDRAEFDAIIKIVSTLSFIAAALLPVFLGLGLEGILFSIMVIYFIEVLFIIIYVLLMRGNLLNLCNLSAYKSQISYSLPLGLAGVIGLTNQNIDKLMISYWFSPRDFAVYARGAFELPLVGILAYTLADLLLPKYVELNAQNKINQMLELWHQSIRKVALIIFPVFVFTFSVATELITFLFTNEYAGSVLIFRIYLCLLPARIAVYGVMLQALRHNKPIFLGSLYSFLLNITLNYLLFKAIGFPGPAAATVFSSLYYAGYLLLKLKKRLSLSLKNLFPWRDLMSIFLIASVPGIFIYPITLLNIASFYVLIVSGIVFSIFYLFMAYRFRIINKEEWNLIREWLSMTKFTSILNSWRLEDAQKP